MATTLPQGLTTGEWTIDSAHSEVSFTARHAGISKVRGIFEQFSGGATIGESLDETSIKVSIKPETINTNQEMRDGHLRGADFFDAEQFPEMTFASTSISGDGENYSISGDLTIRDQTHPVVLETEYNGAAVDQNGDLRAGISASTTINRRDFGLNFTHALDNGSLLVGEKITISIEAELIAPKGE